MGILAYSVLLVFVETLAQVQIGVGAAQEEFIESFICFFDLGFGVKIPLAGGALVGILTAVNLVASSLRFVRFGIRGLGESITHISLLLLIISGGLQYFMRVEGVVTLPEGVPTNAIYSRSLKGGASSVKQLPFSLRLKRFSAKKWEGSDIPKSFESEIWFERGESRVLHVVKMNKPASFGGWTFYQMSYADGGKVSVLSAVRNPARLLPWISVGGAFLGMLLIFIPRVFKRNLEERE